MRVFTRALATLGLAAFAGAPSLSAQTAGVGSNRFYVGASLGGMNFETATQTRGTIPMAGANFLITAKRAALLLAVDAGLGDNESASMLDPVDGLTVRNVTFDNIMRYYFMLMAYPLKSHVQPFIGLGWGIQTLSHIEVEGPFADLDTQKLNEEWASELGSTAFMQAVAGVEIRVGIVNVFGSLSASTGANDDDLVPNAVYTGQAGVRIALGKAKDDAD